MLDTIVSAGGASVTCSVPSYYRVVAVLGEKPPMVVIPAGTFVMGCATNVLPQDEGGEDERPMHTVYVSAFRMDPYEVCKAYWDEVKAWSLSRGYTYTNQGDGKAPNHPVININWFDAVKWCNARSERDGLTPVYYTNAGLTVVFRDGEVTPFSNWSADGYRLPTEAEWEKAARGGAAYARFPWTDTSNTISHAKANYYGKKYDYAYDTSQYFHPAYNCGEPLYTAPVTALPTNGYGLYHMIGNVYEWCWDWYGWSYYSVSPGTDPKGPDIPYPNYITNRVIRGGCWHMDSQSSRVSDRIDWEGRPTKVSHGLGCRCVRND